MTKPSPHRASIVSLYHEGIPACVISRRLNVSRQLVSATISRFKSLGSHSDRTGRGRPVSVSTKAAIKNVRERLRRNPARSIRKLSKEVSISRTSLQRIVKNRLAMKAYKQTRSQFLSV